LHRNIAWVRSLWRGRHIRRGWDVLTYGNSRGYEWPGWRVFELNQCQKLGICCGSLRKRERWTISLDFYDFERWNIGNLFKTGNKYGVKNANFFDARRRLQRLKKRKTIVEIRKVMKGFLRATIKGRSIIVATSTYHVGPNLYATTDCREQPTHLRVPLYPGVFDNDARRVHEWKTATQTGDAVS